MTEAEIPPFYDDLDATREHALALIARGVKDRRSAMHTLTIASVDGEGTPHIRTVVNRGYDAPTRTLRFHTDARAPKLEQLRANRRVGVHFYDPKAKIQLRLTTLATLHHDDALRQSAWQATRDFSRQCYRVTASPGDVVDEPSNVTFTDGQDSEEGVENFVAVTLTILGLEWLYLAHQGHRRARFSWDEAGQLTQTWLVP